ncbi:recombinase family protein [Microbacterium sulfonylureivorans]|uniref:recombinase family protein n=1 Tax=Microbacterium sulfonylureivorans TaxID=2486854 RepID=UPI0013DF9E31|nr:recombinase family protein [Microbacterium sulfonylureivorans]
MTRVVGYSRGFSSDADATLDVAELTREGATLVFSDPAGVDPRARPQLARCLDELADGDVLLVSSAARLSHSVNHFLATIVALDARGVEFRSLAEASLSTGLSAVAPTAVMSELDGLQKRLVGLRTRDGMSAASTAGRRPGRPTVMTDELVAMAVELRAEERSYAQIARVLGVSASAVQRALSITPPAD